MLLIPAFSKQVDFCELKDSLVYITSTRTSRAISEIPSQKQSNSQRTALEAGNMAQRLRALAALPEDQDLISSRHMVATTIYKLQFQAI